MKVEGLGEKGVWFGVGMFLLGGLIVACIAYRNTVKCWCVKLAQFCRRRRRDGEAPPAEEGTSPEATANRETSPKVLGDISEGPLESGVSCCYINLFNRNNFF